MSATVAMDRELVTAGSCPDCGHKLVVSWECGFCGWKDEDEAKLNGVAMENHKEAQQIGSWSKGQMAMMMLISLVFPFFGLFASIYGMFDDHKRKQGAFLLLFTVFAGVLMRFWITRF